MARLTYTLNVSLDGFIETPDHSWGTVDDELHTWFADQLRALDATIQGRRLYEGSCAPW